MDEAFQIGWVLKIWNIANTCSLKDDQCGKKNIFLKSAGTKKLAQASFYYLRR